MKTLVSHMVDIPPFVTDDWQSESLSYWKPWFPYLMLFDSDFSFLCQTLVPEPPAIFPHSSAQAGLDFHESGHQ